MREHTANTVALCALRDECAAAASSLQVCCAPLHPLLCVALCLNPNPLNSKSTRIKCTVSIQAPCCDRHWASMHWVPCPASAHAAPSHAHLHTCNIRRSED